MAETTKIERNPLVDPKPGDWITGVGLSGRRNEIRIDFVAPDEVSFVRFLDGDEDILDRAQPRRLPLARYRAEAPSGAVLWRAEDGPRPSPRPDDFLDEART